MLFDFNTTGALAIEQHPRHPGFGHDFKVASLFRLARKGLRRGSSTPCMGRGLVKSDPFLNRAVEIFIVRQSAFLSGADKGAA